MIKTKAKNTTADPWLQTKTQGSLGRRKIYPSPGFTLIEILVVLTIGSIIVIGTSMSFRQVYRLWEPLEKRRPYADLSRHLCATLRTELAGLYVPVGTDPNQADVTFVLREEDDSFVELSFMTQTPCWHNHPHLGKPARVSYRIEQNPYDNKKYFMRYEQPFAYDIPLAAISRHVITEDIGYLSITTIDPNQTEDEDALSQLAGATLNSPPPAIRIKLSWTDTDKDKLLSTDTILPILSSPLNDPNIIHESET